MTSIIPWLAIITIIGITILCLRKQGRRWLSSSGKFKLWTNVGNSETSKQLFDPFSYTHLLHGFIFCGLFAWFIPKISISWQFCFTIIVFIITELILLIWIKDNLILNIIMLIHPIESIKRWQIKH
jgi:hypothetical protein